MDADCCHCRDHSYYSRWVYAAKSMAFFKIPPQFKQPLITYLRTTMDYVVYPVDYMIALTRGQHPLLMGAFVAALEAIGCPSVRVLVYGIKQPLSLLPDWEPASSNHPLSIHNSFDLGRTVTDNQIVMFRSSYADGQPHIGETPIFLEAGQGYGSVALQLQWESEEYAMKLYPRVVHTLKAIKSKHVATDPKTISAAKNRFEAIRRFLDSFAEVDVKCGARVEATVQAKTLKEACDRISKTPLLNIHSWVTNSIEGMNNHQLDVYYLHPNTAINYADEIVEKIKLSNAIRGRDSKKATPLMVVMLRDCLNAIGWSPRGFRGTYWEDPEAWWRSIELPEGTVYEQGMTPDSVDHYDAEHTPTSQQPPPTGYTPPPTPKRTRVQRAPTTQHLDTVSELKALWKQISNQHPCPHCGRLLTSILDGGNNQFRLKCKVCKKRASKTQLRDHWDNLLQRGELDVDWEKVPHSHMQDRPTMQPASRVLRRRMYRPPPTSNHQRHTREVPSNHQRHTRELSSNHHSPTRAVSDNHHSPTRSVFNNHPHDNTVNDGSHSSATSSNSPPPSPYIRSRNARPPPVIKQPPKKSNPNPDVAVRRRRGKGKGRGKQPPDSPPADELPSDEDFHGSAEQLSKPTRRSTRLTKQPPAKRTATRAESMEGSVEVLIDNTTRQQPPVSEGDDDEQPPSDMEQDDYVPSDDVLSEAGEQPLTKVLPNISQQPQATTKSMPVLYSAEAVFPDELPPTKSLGSSLLATTSFIPKDGDCQFTAISWHHYQTKRSAFMVRSKAIQWLSNNRTHVTSFAATGDGHMGALPYLRHMKKSKVWGDELTLLAASRALKTPLAVASRMPNNQLAWSCYPNNHQGNYFGLYFDNNHYEILCSVD